MVVIFTNHDKPELLYIRALRVVDKKRPVFAVFDYEVGKGGSAEI